MIIEFTIMGKNFETSTTVRLIKVPAQYAIWFDCNYTNKRRQALHSHRSLRSWRDCLCARQNFGGGAWIRAAKSRGQWDSGKEMPHVSLARATIFRQICRLVIGARDILVGKHFRERVKQNLRAFSLYRTVMRADNTQKCADNARRQQSVPAALCYVFMRAHVLLASCCTVVLVVIKSVLVRSLWRPCLSNIGVVGATTDPRHRKSESRLADPCNNESTCSMVDPVNAEHPPQLKESTTSLFHIAKVWIPIELQINGLSRRTKLLQHSKLGGKISSILSPWTLISPSFWPIILRG